MGLWIQALFGTWYEGKRFSCRCSCRKHHHCRSGFYFMFFFFSDSVDAKAFVSGLQNSGLLAPLGGKARFCPRDVVTHECKLFLPFSGSAFQFNKGSLTETRCWSEPHCCLGAARTDKQNLRSNYFRLGLPRWDPVQKPPA